MPESIHGHEIYHNDNVPRGLDYLKELPERDFQEMLEDARTSRDRDTHFQFTHNGRDLRYVLIHHNDGRYELRPKG